MQGRITEGFLGLDREVTLAIVVCWESAHTSSQQPTGKCSGMLQDGCHHSDSMNLAMVGIFIPQILANITNQGSPLHTPHSTLVVRAFNIYQNTTACENLYYRKMILV